MRTIKIDSYCDAYHLYPDDWKGFVYAPEDEFDEMFVIKGNNDFPELTSASWYQDAIKYLDEHDLEETEDNIMDALHKVFPDDKFRKFTITGSVQREWQEVLYKVRDDVYFASDFDSIFEDFYFGYVTEIFDEENNVCEYVAHSEFWEHEDDLTDYVRDLLCIDDDEEVEIMKCDGYVTTKSWSVI